MSEIGVINKWNSPSSLQLEAEGGNMRGDNCRVNIR